MSAPLVVSIPHRLGREEATRRLKGGLSRAAASVPVLSVDEERWDGDRMLFRVRSFDYRVRDFFSPARTPPRTPTIALLPS